MTQPEINKFVTDLIMSSIAGGLPGAQKTTLCLDSVPAPFPSDMRPMTMEEASAFQFPPGFVHGVPNFFPVLPGETTVLRIIPASEASEGDEQPTEFQVGDRVMVIDEAGFEGILYTGDIVTVSGICGDHRLIGIHEAPGQWFAPARFIAATEEMEANRLIEDLQNEVQELDDENNVLVDQNSELNQENGILYQENIHLKRDVIDLTARVQELLDANNAEVERRRAAEARVEELAPMVVQQSLVISGLLVNHMLNN